MLTRKQREQLRQAAARPNRLATAMSLANVTQIQLAEGIGLTQGYVSKIKNGQYTDELPGATMRSIAAYFGCSIEELFPAADEQPVVAPVAIESGDRRADDRREGERRDGDRRRPYERRVEAR